MASRVHIDSTPLLRYTQNRRVIPVRGDTVQAALEVVVRRFPDMLPRLFDEDGKLRRSITVRLNNKDIRQLDNLATELRPDKTNELTIVPGYRVTHRGADMSARKVRPFAALIRGRPADVALELLRFLPNKSARLLEQALKSALGNAESLGARNIDNLIVAESRVDGGPMMKRIQPRARGTAYVIRRRVAHIHITLSDWKD